MTTNSPQFLAFIDNVGAALDRGGNEETILGEVKTAMAQLVSRDDWLAPECAVPNPTYYRQILLHLDPRERFSVVSFVWGPGQATPVHDHTTWGVIGMLRGSEYSQAFRQGPAGVVAHGEEKRLEPGQVAAVSPRIGDIHRVRNAFDDRVSISIHAYGADIGKVRRHVFDPASGAAKEFVSGYSKP